MYGVQSEGWTNRVDNLFTGLRRRTPVGAYGQRPGKLEEVTTIPVENLLS